jgi:hypothetical protein
MIQPKFNINDLVQHKFQKSATIPQVGTQKASFFEVLFITTETCSGGTQIFYRVRPFFPFVEGGYKLETRIIDFAFGIAPDMQGGTSYFREDELKPMSDAEKTFYQLKND